MESSIGKIAYCLYRVSTKGQVEKDDIPMQRESCTQFAAAHGWQIGREFYEKGVSGFKVSAHERDAIQELQSAALEKKFQILLVFMFDRLGRRDDETPFVVEWFVRNGVEVWSVNEGQQRFDTHVDKLMNYIRYWQAGGESIKTSIRTRTRMEQIVREGRYRGGTPPFGYRLEKHGRLNKKNREVFELEVDDEEAAVVRMIFDRYLNAGYGAQRIVRYLLQQGVTTRGGSNFTNTSINRILKNVVYTGVLKSGSVTTEVFPHLQIITPDLFQRTQEIMRQRTMDHGDIPLNMKGKALLAGKLFCGVCGSRLILTTGGHRIYNERGEFVTATKMYYRCHYKVRHPQLCDGQSTYVAENADSIVEQALLRLFQEFRLRPQSERIERQYQDQLAQLQAALNAAEKALKQKTQELNDYMAEVLKVIHGESPFSRELLETLIADCKRQIASLEPARDRAREDLDGSEKSLLDLWDCCRRVDGWAALYSGASLEERKMIVAQIISKVHIWRGYRIVIELNPGYRWLCGSSQLEISGSL